MPKEARDLKQMFLQKKPCLILLAAARVDKPYVSVLMKEADTTFAHTTNILSDMEAYGLIEFVAEGRIKYVRLTRAGKELARSLNSISGLLEGRSTQKSLKKLEIRLDLLEAAIKANNADAKPRKRNEDRLNAIMERLAVLEAEAARYDSQDMRVAIARFKERFVYLLTKFSATSQDDSVPPQDTLAQWTDN
jgi:predicted transcriptional regulator